MGDTQHAQDSTRPVQIGPAFILSLYMLFLGHVSPKPAARGPDCDQSPVYGLGENERKPLWEEAIHKARVRLCRSAQGQQSNGGKNGQLVRGPCSIVESLEYAYHLEIIQDLDDGRVHDDAEAVTPYDGISRAGVRETIPIHQLSKIFYTDTGRILNIGNSEDGENSPVLLKRDLDADRPSKATSGPRNSMDSADERSDGGLGDLEDEQADIDRQLMDEWIALEVYDDEDASENSDTGWIRKRARKITRQRPGAQDEASYSAGFA